MVNIKVDKLEIELKDNLSFMPPLIGYLSSVPEFSYSYKYYHLRHPGGIFNLQFSSIVRIFNSLLDDIESYDPKSSPKSSDKILDKYSSLISVFAKYFESSYEIILCFCNQHQKPKENNFLHKWLDDKEYFSGGKYFKQCNQDYDFFRRLNNQLKHSSNTLRMVYFNSYLYGLIPGYYLESVSSDGSLGPEESLHPKVDKTHTANSFNYDLHRLYYLLYKIPTTLLDVLQHQVKKLYGHELDFNEKFHVEGDDVQQLFHKINALPNFLFFPIEYSINIPFPRLDSNAEKKLIFDMKKPAYTDLRGERVSFSFNGDGFSRIYRMPFFHEIK